MGPLRKLRKAIGKSLCSPSSGVPMESIGVCLSVYDGYVVIDNGILELTLSKPGGIITGVKYNGVDNLMEIRNKEDNRGYWDLVWSEPGGVGVFDVIKGTEFEVILENESQVEVSFTRRWDPSLKGVRVPLKIDKRFIVLRGKSGFYTYAIYEHLEGWPDFNMAETRVAFKLRKDKFHYMGMADDRQRILPMPEDRLPGRCQQLAYPEAVVLKNSINPNLIGEVDDKYQYSCDNKDNKVHGWISLEPPIGFWQITPSDECRTGGPTKQNLTSHVGPTTLAIFLSAHYSGDDLVPKFRNGEYWKKIFLSAHYSGDDLVPKFRNGEYWKKVFGPIFIYLNSSVGQTDPRVLWEDAYLQMTSEVDCWPYAFPLSEDYQKANQRGSVTGRLLVHDRYIDDHDLYASSAYIGLALPGEVGSWQRECKGYQFWTRAEANGSFSINHVLTGEYNIYAWVPGFIGDYMYGLTITVMAGKSIDLGDLVYRPPRDGPTLWEIGYPDRSAAEFYVPDPSPDYVNKLYLDHHERFRQYGLWERYADLYPEGDLVYTVGLSDYRKDWFFAHVTRKNQQNSYSPTTWQIKFKLHRVDQAGKYVLRVAIASATLAELQVRFNDVKAWPVHFSTGLIGRDNSIARHGIHGLYWLYNIVVQTRWLLEGENTIFLTQARSLSPFQGIMYDYIRLEGPLNT